MEANYYEILGISPSASLGEVKKAFRLLVKLHHPDKCGDANVADKTAKYLQVKQAFETLSDGRARQDYDNWLRCRERDNKDRDSAADKRDEFGCTDAADAAVRRLFANSFFNGHDKKRGDAQEHFDSSRPCQNGIHSCDFPEEKLKGKLHTRESEIDNNTELFQRLNVEDEPLSHSDGFQRWLRTRPATSLTIVNDEVILRTQGAAITTKDEVVHHPYTWPVTAVVSGVRMGAEFEKIQTDSIPWKESEDSGARENNRPHSSARTSRAARITRSDELSKSGNNLVDECVKLTKVALKRELEWGDVLVRILHAPVLPYDCILLREGLDVLAAAADSIREEDKSSFLNTRAPSFVTRAHSSEPGGKGDFLLGTSCVAEVVEVGRGVKELQKGDIVLPLSASDGCWRAAAVWQERRLMALPSDLLPKLEQAAVAKQLFLAYHLLQEYAQELQPGDALLIYGSGCLVSQLLVQFCRLLGFRSFFMWRRQRQQDAATQCIKDYFKSLGATEVFEEQEDIVARLTKSRQSLPVLAIELDHGKQICTSIQWLVKKGKIVLAYEAEACAFPPSLGGPSLPMLLSREIKVESFYLNGWLESRRNQQKMLKALECVGALLRAGKLIINLTEVHDLSDTSVKAALVSVRHPWNGLNLQQQPLLTFASLEAEKVAFEENQKVNALREKEAREVQETLFSQRDRVLSTARSVQAQDGDVACLKAHREDVELHAELSATEAQNEMQVPTCFFLHDRGEVVEELLIMFKRYKQNMDETFQNAKFFFPAAPYECHDEDADASSWSGQHAQILFAPVDRKTEFVRRVTCGFRGSTQISPDEIEALKDLEASCEYLADIIEEKVGVSGEKARGLVLCGVGEGGLVALLTALTKLQVRVEAVVCIGMPLLDAHILSFLLSKANKEAQKAKLFFLCGSKDSLCPAWCQEALREFFSNAGYCATKEVILDGAHETGDRTLAHLAAVFSILKLG